MIIDCYLYILWVIARHLLRILSCAEIYRHQNQNHSDICSECQCYLGRSTGQLQLENCVLVALVDHMKMQLLKHSKQIVDILFTVTTKHGILVKYYSGTFIVAIEQEKFTRKQCQNFIGVDLGWLLYQVGFVTVVVCFIANYGATHLKTFNGTYFDFVIHVSISLIQVSF